MFSIRNPRLGLVGAAATVMLAALSLTACSNDGSGSRAESGTDGGAATTLAPDAGAPADAAATAGGSGPATTAPSDATSAPSAASGGSQPTGKPAAAQGKGKAPASAGQPVTCEGSNTKTVAAPLNRPVNHMLLTVTNTGSKACYLYNYPQLQFTGAQSVPPVIKGSVPQAVVTLNPGESGYASVALSAADGSGTNGRTVKTLTVYFQGRSGSGSVGSGAHPQLPAKGLYIDDSLTTTYWQQTMDLALAW